MKLQLFKFNNDEVKLVNLDVTKMNDKGEMPAWVCKHGEVSSSLTNWSELESSAIIIEWHDVSNDVKSRLAKVALSIIDEDVRMRESLVPSHQQDESNEVYKGHLVKKRMKI